MSDTEKNKDLRYKRYLMFGYSDYYPEGAVNEVVDSFDTLEEVIYFLSSGKLGDKHCDVLDLEDRKWITR